MQDMRKYQGQVVHRQRSPDGVIEVVENQLTRSLHFGDPTRQSAMDLYRPTVLVLEYTQTMMACLLFNPRPRRALILGLGGGSLAKFLLHHFPECHIDAVEPARCVLAIARSHFELPTSRNLTVHITDALSFATAKSRAQTNYDLLLVDVYNATGIVPCVTQAGFLAAAREMLCTDGVLCMNLSRPQRDLYRQGLRNLRKCFPERVYRLPVIAKGNEIALALQPGVEPGSLRELRARAEALQESLGLEFRDFLERMRRHNPSLLDRLLA